MKQTAQTWLTRLDPRAAALVAAHVDPVDRARKEEHAQWVIDAMRKAFERECQREGIDPARGVSPSLLQQLGTGNVADA